jgi:hypothetical protein
VSYLIAGRHAQEPGNLQESVLEYKKNLGEPATSMAHKRSFPTRKTETVKIGNCWIAGISATGMMMRLWNQIGQRAMTAGTSTFGTP